MNIKKVMQWAILAVCLTASVLNILYLAGVCGQHAATYGFLLVVGCFAAHLLLKRRYAETQAANVTPLENARGILTATFAVVWLITAGMAFVWIR